MTGWQGNEGGWNPQQDPYGGQYGGQQQPYGGQQPYGETYGGQYYSADPYPNPTSAYPAYQPGGFGPPPPPKRSKLPIILSIVAIFAVVGTVVTIVLINRQSADQPIAGPTSSASRPPSTTRSAPASSRKLPVPSTKPPAKDGWTTIDMSGGSYQVPNDWKKNPEPRDSGLGVNFDGGASVGDYKCGANNAEYFRGFTASGEVQSKDGSELDVGQAVSDFAKSFAGKFYANPKVDVPAPSTTTLNGRKAAQVTAKLTVAPTDAACEATAGEVAVLGVALEEGGKTAGVRMVVVVNDLAGGPATPPALPDPLAEEILSTVAFS